MVRTLVFIFLFSLTVQGYSQVTIEEIRQQLVYEYESFDRDRTEEFYDKIHHYQDPSPVIQAYQGIAEAMMAKVKWDPIRKLSYLSSARDIIDQAIARDSRNLEIRFLRFSLESHVPAIFRYGDTMRADKKVIIQELQKLDSHWFQDDMVRFMVDFMAESELCTNDEIASIRSRAALSRR